MASIILPDADATIAFGNEVGRSLESGAVLALIGDLGAGKTHFVKGLAAGLGGELDVMSPTFTLVHEYPCARLPLFHFDLYRLDAEREVLEIGFHDYLEEDGVVVVEWADKFPDLFPAATRWFHFRHRPDGSREVREA